MKTTVRICLTVVFYFLEICIYTTKLYKIVHFVSSSAVENLCYISTALDKTKIRLDCIEIVFSITLEFVDSNNVKFQIPK